MLDVSMVVNVQHFFGSLFPHGDYASVIPILRVGQGAEHTREGRSFCEKNHHERIRLTAHKAFARRGLLGLAWPFRGLIADAISTAMSNDTAAFFANKKKKKGFKFNANLVDADALASKDHV
jgi:hypothetical protein